jgi:nucleoside-diphosphate-sugar epimerase
VNQPTTDRSAVLVTGAAGRLGRTVAARLHDDGIDLIATDVAHGGEVPYRFETADLRDHAQISALLDGVGTVVHLGNHPGIGRRPPAVVFNENVTMNENVFQGAAEHGVRKIVFASTLQLIGSHPDTRTVVDPPPEPSFPLSGATEPRPANVYALSKTVGEVMLRYYAERCGIDCVALRFPLLHHDDDRVRVALGEESPTAQFEGFTGLSYDDAARLIGAVIATELPGYRVYMPALANRHRDLTTAELIRARYPDVPAGTSTLVDISAIVEETGWHPSPHPDWEQPASDRKQS